MTMNHARHATAHRIRRLRRLNTCVSVVTSEESDDAAIEPVTASLTETHGLFRLDSECGGPTDATVVVIEAERSPDAVAMVMRRRIGSDSDLIRIQLLFNDRSTVGLVDHASEGGDAAYEISAVELARNVSVPTVVPVDLGCAGLLIRRERAPGVPRGLRLVPPSPSPETPPIRPRFPF